MTGSEGRNSVNGTLHADGGLTDGFYKCSARSRVVLLVSRQGGVRRLSTLPLLDQPISRTLAPEERGSRP